jgi:hypothetical protein
MTRNFLPSSAAESQPASGTLPFAECDIFVTVVSRFVTHL